MPPTALNDRSNDKPKELTCGEVIKGAWVSDLSRARFCYLVILFYTFLEGFMYRANFILNM